MISLDVETRGPLDVTKVGLYRHAKHVKILGMRYRLAPDEELREWRGYFADGETADCSDAPPVDLIKAVESGDLILAHNAGYERVTLRNQPWWPDVPIEQYICSASWGASFNLPRSLDGLSTALLPPEQAKLSKNSVARIKYMWDSSRELHSAEDMDAQMDYCGQDVTAMELCMGKLPEVDPVWLAQYHANEHINDRGVLVDNELIAAVLEMRPTIEAALLKDIEQATGGEVRLRGPSLLKWLKANLPEDMLDCLIVNKKVREGYSFKTVKKESADKTARQQILEAIEDRTDCPGVRRALTAFNEANKAAVTKFAAAGQRVSEDGYLRGQTVFNGAGQTGRFSSHGMQVHNLKRAVHPDAVEVIKDIIEHATRPTVLAKRWGLSINDLCSQVLRPVFEASDGCHLYWGDWSSVEARTLPWLANDADADKVLEVHRSGQDIYKREAGNIYGIAEAEVDADQRQIGKVAVLSLGYQGGVGAFQSMAGNYGVEMEDAEADRIKTAWRAANPWATALWRDLEDAAMGAIDNANIMYHAGRVAYQFLPGLLGGSLLCWLPSGRWLCYPKARIKMVEKFEDSPPQPAIVFMHPTYGPSSTYGGSLAENVTQGECATLLREKLVQCEQEGLQTVMHVHDEIIGEAEYGVQLEQDMLTLSDIMNDVPSWAKGLPLNADVEHGPRYKIKR